MKTDLNLLRVFDVLIELGSVSRAAARLGLTQSAVSHALARLREQLDDPLFVRAQGGLRPTPRAIEIAAKVREGLSLLRDAVLHPLFDPATTTRIFTLGASSYFCVSLLPRAISLARREAPLAQFRIVAPGDDPLGGIEDGSIDLAFSSFDKVPSRFVMQPLYKEKLVWVGRADGPAGPVGARARLAVARSRAASTEPASGLGTLERRIATLPEGAEPGLNPVIIHDALSAGAFIANSDLVALLPAQLVRLVSDRAGLKVLENSDQDDVALSMIWHSRANADAAHGWLRGIMAKTAAEIEGRG
jgi:DNA-binding transcriptional LysR family regulator